LFGICFRNNDCWQKEVEFQQFLLGLARCKILTQKFSEVMLLRLFIAANRLSSLNFNHKYDYIVDRHTELVNKLKTTDPDAAERAIREHLV
jgi:DNA-binding GntR family transcriptional regulator